MSEALEPGSSDSLETTLGMGTEVGRSTFASQTSSSTPGLSDPTVASSDSSGRPSPPPLPPEGSGVSAAAAALSRPPPAGEGRAADQSWATTQPQHAALQLLPPSSGQVAGPVPSPPGPTPGAAAQQPAPRPSQQGPDSQLEQLQLQFKQQAERQDQIMLMMNHLMTKMNAASDTPQPGRAETRPLTPPPPAVQRGPAVAAQPHNPWAPPPPERQGL